MFLLTYEEVESVHINSDIVAADAPDVPLFSPIIDQYGYTPSIKVPDPCVSLNTRQLRAKLKFRYSPSHQVPV